MHPQIPVASADLSGNEEAFVVAAIRSSWISSTGPYVARFEGEFARLCDVRFALSVCNGTVALHLALLGLGVRPGDEVIVPSLTYVATANAVRYVGAEPVFVDVDPQTWCLDPARVEEAITRRTRGILAVHLMGHPADMDRLKQIAAVHGLWVVEDAAEALLARYKGRPVGSLGHVATFSFFGNKLFTSGEGGAVTVNDEGLNTRMRILRGQGMDPQRRYYFPVTGYNFRLTNVACAILCAQLERREQIMERRRAIYATYDRLLGGIPGIALQPVAPWAELSPWMYVVRIDADQFGCTRDQLMSHLVQQNIETRPMFVPLHTLPPFREESRRRGECLPVTDQVSASAVMLPTYTQLTPGDQGRVVDAIAAVQQQFGARGTAQRRAA
ncbi:MAG TPA: DegT/DnrJ/EryC1/StrS family aminotransferase [Gemmataceae bacterium]|nr:DegT/DnrJ/EryC1/StrS family aminotransferase [Gemmataceae bacterium]